jgi:hypothetical protein
MADHGKVTKEIYGRPMENNSILEKFVFTNSS